MSYHWHWDAARHVSIMCWHRCRPIRTLSFWLGLTLGFPLEHLLWERVPPFAMITRWLGL